ncbi:hypothetical protein MUG84_17760 [Paenibacillus sp. KQZ6P-2]|uniref:Uncharacterized protein n=1 Tax=Paenibacillus mangrovi TaxID=2931978 RepID=A0A9X1WQQ1_9BACL|nr:hypothetical protein [Paenibacillus mangrovi]MCJ8013572.1 hypothetical protein [Paenibacillus mangrovi]
MQERQTTVNRQAWNTKAYEAWLTHFGTPKERAEDLKINAKYTLRRWLKYIGDPKEIGLLIFWDQLEVKQFL